MTLRKNVNTGEFFRSSSQFKRQLICRLTFKSDKYPSQQSKAKCQCNCIYRNLNHLLSIFCQVSIVILHIINQRNHIAASSFSNRRIWCNGEL